jgi:O-antigen ligase
MHDLSGVLAPLRLAAVATGASWVLLIVDPRWARVRQALRYPYVAAFFAWSAWMFFITPYAFAPPLTWEFLTSSHLTTVTLVLFLLGGLGTFADVRLMLTAHATGAVVMVFFYAKQGFPDWTPVPMYDRNDLALLLVLTAPLLSYLAMSVSRTKPAAAKFLWVLALSVVASVIMSRSRGGFLAIAAVALFITLCLESISFRLRIAPPLFLIFGLLLAPENVRTRIFTLGALEQDYNIQEDAGRIEIWKRGLVYLRDKPIVGYGADSYRLVEGSLAPQAGYGAQEWNGMTAHNSFLQIAVENGLVGLGLFLAMVLSTFARMAGLRRRLRGRVDAEAIQARILATLIMACVVGYLVGGFFLSAGYSVMLVSVVVVAAGLETAIAGPQDAAGRRPQVARRRSRLPA